MMAFLYDDGSSCVFQDEETFEEVSPSLPRHAASAARLAGFFTEAGATATACPAVRVSPIPAASDNILQLEMACQDLSTVNAVVLASRWAVEAFAERLCRFHGGAVGARQELERSKVRLAATAAAADPLLQRLGVPPAVQVSDGPAGALQLADALAGAAVLWPAPVYVNISEPQPLRAMEAALTARGAALQRVGAYMVRPGDGAQARAELELLRAGEVSVLALTSALEVQGLRHMLGDSLDPVPRGVAVCCSSLEAATEARALGLHAALEPLDADLSIEVLPSAFSLPPSALRPPRRRAAAPTARPDGGARGAGLRVPRRQNLRGPPGAHPLDVRSFMRRATPDTPVGRHPIRGRGRGRAASQVC